MALRVPQKYNPALAELAVRRILRAPAPEGLRVAPSVTSAVAPEYDRAEAWRHVVAVPDGDTGFKLWSKVLDIPLRGPDNRVLRYDWEEEIEKVRKYQRRRVPRSADAGS